MKKIEDALKMKKGEEALEKDEEEQREKIEE